MFFHHISSLNAYKVHNNPSKNSCDDEEVVATGGQTEEHWERSKGCHRLNFSSQTPPEWQAILLIHPQNSKTNQQKKKYNQIKIRILKEVDLMGIAGRAIRKWLSATITVGRGEDAQCR